MINQGLSDSNFVLRLPIYPRVLTGFRCSWWRHRPAGVHNYQVSRAINTDCYTDEEAAKG